MILYRVGRDNNFRRLDAVRLATAIEQNQRRVWAICYRMTGRATDANDLSQEAIARALARAEQIVDADLTGWLLRVATNVCLDHRRAPMTCASCR